jgi:hypothetical protein
MLLGTLGNHLLRIFCGAVVLAQGWAGPLELVAAWTIGGIAFLGGFLFAFWGGRTALRHGVRVWIGERVNVAGSLYMLALVLLATLVALPIVLSCVILTIEPLFPPGVGRITTVIAVMVLCPFALPAVAFKPLRRLGRDFSSMVVADDPAECWNVAWVVDDSHEERTANAIHFDRLDPEF